MHDGYRSGVMTIAPIGLEKNLSSVLRTLYEEICPVRR